MVTDSAFNLARHGEADDTQHVIYLRDQINFNSCWTQQRACVVRTFSSISANNLRVFQESGFLIVIFERLISFGYQNAVLLHSPCFFTLADRTTVEGMIQ